MISTQFFNLPFARWQPHFDELDRMRRQLDRLLDFQRPLFRAPVAGVFPLVNLTEDKDNYYIRAELPGIKAEDLELQITHNRVSIAGERKLQKEEENAKFHRRERDAGRFSRIMTLPGQIDSGKVEAELRHGMLTLTVPKAEAAKPRQIQIK